MNPAARLLVSFLISLALVFFAGWFAIADSAMPEGTSLVSRLGLTLLFLIAAILLGEVSKLRVHFGMLMGAIKAARGGEGENPLTPAVPRDPAEAKRHAVAILIKSLDSDDARETAHGHLIRLTGQDLPADSASWRAWWAENEDSFIAE